MTRGGLVAVTVLLALAPAATVACGGGGDDASGTLPPIATTTSTTILITTTTEYVPVTYEIQSGDSLKAIAEQFGVDMKKLQILNGITNPDAIEAGDVLQIPPPTVPAATTDTPTT